MILQFLCPNGHKVHCSEERAGQAAKCPRCGVKFRIPTIEELQPTDASEMASESSMKVGSGSGSPSTASGIGLGGAVGPDEIEFLCPNDHLLHGPASLQDRPGRCPECGSRFRIPVYTEHPPAPAPSEGGFPGPLDTNSLHLSASEASVYSASRAVLDVEPAGTAGPALSSADPAIHTQATARLVSRLWAWKTQGATIELRFGDGHRLTPDLFIPSLTTPSHGVFAVTESNGTYTITAIAWDAIQVVIARGVKQLPG